MLRVTRFDIHCHLGVCLQSGRLVSCSSLIDLSGAAILFGYYYLFCLAISVDICRRFFFSSYIVEGETRVVSVASETVS